VEISGWDLAAMFAKAVTYAAALGASGLIFFLAYCNTLLRDRQRATLRRLVGLLIGAAAMASILRILLLAGSMGGDLASMFSGHFAAMLISAGEGRATGLRLGGLTLALCAMSANPRLRGPGIAGAIIAATSFAWVGHIHGLAPNTAPTLLLCLHLLCAAFWLGALPALAVIAAGDNEAQIAAAAARFGHLALRVVALLVAAGASLLFMLINDAAQFWGSGYGRMMAVKLVAVAGLLGIAAWNKLYLTPKLLNRHARAVLMFRRSVFAEILAGALILLITAAFTTLSGPP
jgi:putative copper resistance protein D